MPRHRKVEKWADIVRELALDLSEPLSYVTADDVKRITGEEPRLMASMTARKRLPEVFRDYGVFLLPVSDKQYVIVKGKGYHELEEIESYPRRFRARLPFELTTLAYGSGESRYLNHADSSGLLSHFSGVGELHPTLGGKMRTGVFEFRVDGSPDIRVEGAQIEIDAGYEGREDVLLFEAKVGKWRTFIIRQLYYPYRTIQGATPKNVRSFFFLADRVTKTYNLWEYRFTDPFDYETLSLVKAASFVIETTEPPLEALEAIEPDPKLDIVPQANDFQKVADFPLRVYSGVDTAKQWAEAYDITVRQGSYYREAAEAMGLVRLEAGHYAITQDGQRYIRMNQQQRGDFLAERLLKIPIVNKVFRLVQERPRRGVSKEDIASLIQKISHLGGTTPMRRASTILAYFKWMARATGAVVVRKGVIYPRQATLNSYASGAKRDA